DIDTRLPRSRCDLEADPAGAYHHDAADLVEDLPQPQRVRQFAQVVDARQVGSGDLKPARPCACGQGEFGEGDLAVCQRYRAAVEIHAGDRAAEHEVDRVVRVPLFRVDQCRVGLGGSHED